MREQWAIKGNYFSAHRVYDRDRDFEADRKWLLKHKVLYQYKAWRSDRSFDSPTHVHFYFKDERYAILFNLKG